MKMSALSPDDDVPPIWDTDENFMLNDSIHSSDNQAPPGDDEFLLDDGDDRSTTFLYGVSTRQRVESPKKHFFFIRWICKRPKTMFFLALMGHVAFVAITAVLYFTGYNILPLILDDMPAFNMHDTMYRRELAWLEKDQNYSVFLFDAQYPTKRRRLLSEHVPEADIAHSRTRRWAKNVYQERLHLLYESMNVDENVFDPERLGAIRKFETQLENGFEEGKEYATPAHWFCGHDSVVGIYENNLSKIRDKYLKDESVIWSHIGNDGVIDKATGKAKSKLTRSIFTMCYVNTFHNITVWTLDVVIPEVLRLEQDILKPAGVRLYYWSYRAYSEQIYRVAMHDVFFFIGSISFIFIFMWVQTSSLWITFFGTISILTSFIGANLIYNCIVGYQYLSLFNLMALFVVLGIGADDIFVFVDCWKSLRDITSMEERMSKCFRRAGVAMFTTSLTTMVAFFVSSFSQLLPISAFGSFAGLTVFVNYISVIVFFPTVVSVHHHHFENICSKDNDQYSSATRGRIFDRVSKFFGGAFFDTVTHRITKWISLSAFGLLATGMIISCTDSRLDQNLFLKAFKGNNMFETALLMTAFDFKLGVNDKMVLVYMVWGLEPRNMDQCDRLKYVRWNPCQGLPAKDIHFSLESAENQLAMLNLCNNITHLQGPSRDDLKLDRDKNGNRVVCFMQYFDTYLRTNLSKQLGQEIRLPLTKEKLKPIVPLLRYAGLDLDLDKVTNPFQTFLAIWVEQFVPDLKKVLGFQKSEHSVIVGKYKDKVLYDQTLKYAAVVAPLAVKDIRLTVDDGVILMNYWEDFMTDQVSHLPVGLKGGWQFATNWFLCRQKVNLMHRALWGIAISLGLAFFVLLLTTRNVILAILAEITLSLAVVCVIGVLPLAGWKFGVMESINVCFVAGLAVDYIVHMVEAYNMSEFKTRQDRTRDALKRIGISVLSGAVTTLGASCFMFFSKILFFMQFGTFIFCTVGFSLVFALIFFPVLLSICGPSGDTGSAKWFYLMVKRRLCDRRT
ncbi:protein dispatched-like [Lineus longissimus]|uniref:protein dispatched-like n=1 Tax=Lineus longissimus TaxID=88925 RepID=UPI002B4D26C8